MIINIKDKEIKLKYSFRSLILYENIQNKSFEPASTTDTIVFFYCVVVASDKDLDVSFDEFLDLLDEKPELFMEFAEFLSNEWEKTRMFSPTEEEDVKKKKMRLFNKKK